MTRARATLVSVEDTPYYHCIGRCVRRAYLCGMDDHSGRSYEHRRQWMQSRLKLLTDVFAIELCAYALMSNHYHLVVKLTPERVQRWSEREVVERWTQLFKGPPVAHKYLQGDGLSAAEQVQLNERVGHWRERLGDLSWFMRCLNEHIARRANAEDECTGHFWESRFKSQALLDDIALLMGMAYVDLNPVRAGIAQTVADSDYTSGQVRWRSNTAAGSGRCEGETPALLPFVGAEHADSPDTLPFNLQDYLDLLADSGHMLCPERRRARPRSQPRLLARLGLASKAWVITITELPRHFELAVGAPNELQALARRWGKRWLHGIAGARRLYPAPSS